MIRKLAIGTAQWGLNYGLCNNLGKTSDQDIKLILNLAKRLGISIVDTAQAYGDAESRMGAHNMIDFNVVTKINGLKSKECVQQIPEQIYRSLERLGIENMYGVLLHNAEDLSEPHGREIVSTLEALKSSGHILKIGVSLYDEDQADFVLKIFTPDILQVPLNVLDQRFLINGYLREFKKRGIEVHARSIFLQGLLLMQPDQVPQYFKRFLPSLRSWHRAANEQAMSLCTAAMSFVTTLDDVDFAITGFANFDQFNSVTQDISLNSIFDATNLESFDRGLINPSTWT